MTTMNVSDRDELKKKLVCFLEWLISGNVRNAEMSRTSYNLRGE